MAEPFFSTKLTGEGLGLAICQAILADFNGRLEIISDTELGTQVTVWLPLAATTMDPST